MASYFSSFSCLCIILDLVCYVTLGKEQDIYHVITGESDVPHKKSLEPVYYVGIYDEKPKLIPTKYEIELMTADSGKRFTCIIPTDTGFQHTDDIVQNTENTEEAHQTQSAIEDTTDTTLFDESEYMEPEAEKSAEERFQEVDTLENRDRYIQELIVQAMNRHKNANKNKKQNKKQSAPCYYTRDGYWHYELCLYGKIEQYHGTKRKRNPKIKLGEFATYIDVSKILMNDKLYPYLYLTDIYGLTLFENTEKNYVHLLYNGGEAKRETLVTIQCSKAHGQRTKNGIVKVSEPKIHRYHMVLIYTGVCDYKQWLRREYGIYGSEGVNGVGYDAIESDSTVHGEDEISSSSDLLYKKNINPNSDDVSLLLSPLLDFAKDNRCLLLKQGWWTVEFCYGEFIRQIHLEPKKQKNTKGNMVSSLTEWDIKQEHVIGIWDSADKKTKESFTIHKNDLNPERTYASIVYDNGAQCDLTKDPRKTEIQFRCGLNKDQSELIKSTEDPSCYYTAQVNTPLLCGHPDFKIPSAPKHEILCYPFDEKEFVEPASAMKAVADIEAERDALLRIVTTAAQEKYKSQQQHGMDIIVEDTNNNDDDDNKVQPKTEL